MIDCSVRPLCTRVFSQCLYSLAPCLAMLVQQNTNERDAVFDSSVKYLSRVSVFAIDREVGFISL